MDAHTIRGNEVCEKYFTRKNPLLKISNLEKTIGSQAAIWCYSPNTDPMPILRKVSRYVTTTQGASAYVLCENRPGSAAQMFLQQFEVCHSFPMGTNLFAVPVQGTNSTSFLPTPPTTVIHNVYKISHDPTAAITAKLSKMNVGNSQYIFNVRIGRLAVRANTSYKSHILTEEEKQELKENYIDKRQKLALGDTGATNSLITSRAARQIKAFIDETDTGKVILGDNISTVNLLGSCTFEMKIGNYTSTVKAYVIDADWGVSQQLVLGSDWISQNGAMLGDPDGKGPQMLVNNETVYAKHKSQPFVSSEKPVIGLNAFNFANFLESSGTGREWTAIDITSEGVQHEGRERIPLNVYLSETQYWEYECSKQVPSLNAMTVQPGIEQPVSPVSDVRVRNPPDIPFDPSTFTKGGVRLDFLESLKTEFPKVFRGDLPDRTDGSEPRVHRESIHTINLLPNAKPSFRKAWRTSPAERQEIDKQVAYMLSKGLIKPSSSPWGAPTLFAPKSDGTLRMCIDYRGLNAVTERDVYPLPRVDDVYAAIKGKKVFSTLDLLKGYWQIGIQPCDRHLTAFTTPTGLYESTVLTFGLTNAPSTFQRFMNNIFHDMIARKEVIVYLDDILIMGEDVASHNRILKEVLSRLSTENLIVRFDKCTFGAETIKFLGFVIGKEQIRIDDKKIEAIKNWPLPTTVTELRAFLGLANYLRKFMPDYASISSPLTGATGSKKKGSPLVMNDKQVKAFAHIKRLLMSPPVLAVEDPSRPYEVITDASGLGIGAVLLQRDDAGNPRVIAYESKAFASKGSAVKAQFDSNGTPLQRQEGLDEASLEDASGKQELAALIHALKIWRCNLEGAEFTVYVDHNPLVHLLQKKVLNRWQVRILDTLATYPGLKIVHIPGKDNIADGLSRIDHKIAQVAAMPRATLAEQPAIKAAVLEAMQTWPVIEEGDSLVPVPPVLPYPCASDSKLLSHDNTLDDCVSKLTTLFAMAVNLHSTTDVGKSHSTRSKTRQQLEIPPQNHTRQKRMKTSTIPQVVEEHHQDVPVVNEIEVISTAQETMNQESAEDFAGDFIACCKEGYVKHPASKILLQEATAPHWIQQKGLWYFKGALYVPDHYNLRTDCISKYHDTPMQGHPDSQRTYQSVKRFYYWPLMRSHITEYVQTCDSCQRFKKSTSLPSGLLQATPLPPLNEKGRHWIVDFATKLPLTESGHCEIMVMKSWDKFTILKECEPGMGAEGAANLFIQSVSAFGPPLTFRGDRDSRFNTTLFTDILNKVGCEVHLASVDHHQSVGAAERTIGQVKQMLRHFINPTHTNWQELLLPIQHALNNGFCAALGTTPSYYMFGTYPDSPKTEEMLALTNGRSTWDKVVTLARDYLEKARQQLITTANKKRGNIEFKVGDTVLLSTKHPWFQTMEGVRKLIPAWSGPFRVKEVLHKTSCILDLPSDIKTHNQFHTSLLKHYHPRTRTHLHPKPTRIDGQDHYEVDQVLNYRKRRRGKTSIEQYRVYFVGYGPEYNMWLPLSLLECPEKISEYHVRRKANIGKRSIAGWLLSNLLLT